jgi:hypothetical protein
MQLTRSGSDPTAFCAQSFWQQRRSFTPSKGNAMQRTPQIDRSQRSWVDQPFGSKSCATDRFDGTGRPRSVVYADLNGPNVDPPFEHARPGRRWDNPRVATGASSGRVIGRSGFGPLRKGAVGRPARTSQTRAGRPPHQLVVRIYRALILATLGCVGFAMFWLILHLGSR